MGVKQIIESEHAEAEKVAEIITSAREYLKTNPDNFYPPVIKSCLNENEMCSAWAAIGECERDKEYMKHSCKAACQSCLFNIDELEPNNNGDDMTCSADDQSCQDNNVPTCIDRHEDCEYWASKGECEENPEYMNVKCRLSCLLCSNVM